MTSCFPRNSRLPILGLLLCAVLAAGPVHADRAPDSTGARPRGASPSFVDLITRADSAVKARGGAAAPHARLYLSWHRPWGQPGATQMLTPDLAHPSAEDTLYLCFLPGRASTSFTGFTANLLIRPQPGDSLGPFWDFSKTGPNAGALAVQFGPDPSFPMRQPWTTRGMGQPVLERTPSGTRLRMVYAVGYLQGGTVDSATVQCLARVIVRHKNAHLAGATQPVCIEWESATLAYAMRDEPEVRLGERFACWGGKGAAACVPFRSPARAPAWKPGAASPRGR
ncbi:MAG: hypothetical protein U0704_17130 [Candidatus Eisenbacteria bacterium]